MYMVVYFLLHNFAVPNLSACKRRSQKCKLILAQDWFMKLNMRKRLRELDRLNLGEEVTKELISEGSDRGVEISR